jgi:type I restriction enzyme, R subunit
MKTGEEGYLTKWPSPQELWALAFPAPNFWRDRFAEIPFVEKGENWSLRYYQANAVNKALERVAGGGKRILLALATGTGKTTIAFQFAWKLFEAKWSLSGEPTRRPRILFLADRNILARQAFNDFNTFAAFEEKALVRVKPDTIAKKGVVPKNGAVFFTIFQTFMSGRDANGEPAPYFGDYPSDFFDCIIIDECHRGGARDESTWRKILEYFEPALQLGLTATPKRDANADTYAYFGEPVYVYSLKEGINDGYLTPFKVRQLATTLDDYVYTSDDEVIDGEVEEGKRYTEADFNHIIEIKAREEYRVRTFMNLIDQNDKTLVFCATQDHALAVRDLINQMKTSKDPHYCERVTSDEGKIGDEHLENFQDNDKTIPTILTTSQKLSTGVDARNVRNIVLMRPIRSMIEFKQIIGRGTRCYDGKDYFTIYDFVRAYDHFNDPAWDGEPPEPEEPGPRRPRGAMEEGPQTPYDATVAEGPGAPPKMLKIKLADGKERAIQHMMATSFWSADGRPISAAQFIESLFGELPAFFKDEDELRRIWSGPATRKRLLEGLSEKGYGVGELEAIGAAIGAEKSDVFDVLAYVAFTTAPKTREERAKAGKSRIAGVYDANLQAFLDFVLAHYVDQGVTELEPEKLVPLVSLKYGSISEAAAILGAPAAIREAFLGFQKHLYGG